MDAKQMIIEPKVDSVQEFIEIALDFSNPLDLVREAIRMHLTQKLII